MRVTESLFQVPLRLEKKEFDFKPFRDSNAVYDVYCEIIPDRLKRLQPLLASYEFETDLYGMKSANDSGHTSSASGSRHSWLNQKDISSSSSRSLAEIRLGGKRFS